MSRQLKTTGVELRLLVVIITVGVGLLIAAFAIAAQIAVAFQL